MYSYFDLGFTIFCTWSLHANRLANLSIITSFSIMLFSLWPTIHTQRMNDGIERLS